MNDFIARPIVENLLFALFVLIVCSLVLARFTVFKTTNRRSLVGSFFMTQLLPPILDSRLTVILQTATTILFR